MNAPKDLDVLRETLALVISETEQDARLFDGLPFTGATVAEYFGNQGAAIVALANICGRLLDLIEQS